MAQQHAAAVAAVRAGQRGARPTCVCGGGRTDTLQAWQSRLGIDGGLDRRVDAGRQHVIADLRSAGAATQRQEQSSRQVGLGMGGESVGSRVKGFRCIGASDLSSGRGQGNLAGIAARAWTLVLVATQQWERGGLGSAAARCALVHRLSERTSTEPAAWARAMTRQKLMASPRAQYSLASTMVKSEQPPRADTKSTDRGLTAAWCCVDCLRAAGG